MTACDNLHTRLQPIFADLLAEYGITTGDIDPLTDIELEEAEGGLAAVFEHLVRLAA